MKGFSRTAALLLAVLMIFSCVPLSLFAAESPVKSPDYSHSDPGKRTVSLSPSHLLEALTGTAPSVAEADYANRHFDRLLLYYDQIPASHAFLAYKDNTVSVTAYPFSYTAANGETVTWIPTEVVYSTATPVPLAEQSGVYTCAVTGVNEATGRDVRIVYSCQLTVPAAMAVDLISFAYAEADEAEHLPTAEEYAAALAAYRAYLAAMDHYRDAYIAYEAYLAACDEYKTKQAEYEAYRLRVKEYEAQYDTYKKYVDAMTAYRAERAEYDRIYRENGDAAEAYVQYLNNLNRIRLSLYAMESLFLAPSSKKTGTLYNALQNAELVTMFERYRDTLVTIYGVSDATLTHLRKTSDELNVILSGYAAARAVSEAEAFAYYQAHYDELCTLFNYLYNNMREIISGMIFNHICALMEVEYDAEFATYRKWRIKNIVCHIYLICLCLDDARTADGQWEFFSDSGKRHTYAFTDLLDQNLILTDTNTASPTGLSFPAEVERVVLPDPPKEPAYVAEPTAPAPMSEPIPPTTVTEPTEPEEVAPVSEPTDQDREKFAFAERAAAIIAEKKAGRLPKRTEADIVSRTVTLTTSITRPIAFGDHPMVSFYNGDGSYLYATEVTEGSQIPLPLTPPTLADDAAYFYAFLGWALQPDGDVLSEENAALAAMPKEGISLYAVYQKTLRTYTVTVDLQNGTPPTEATYSYGQMPILPASPARPATAATTYTFSGWSPTPAAVTQSVTYTAQYLPADRTYAISYVTPFGTTERQTPYNETTPPTAPTVPATYYEGCVRYDFTGWSPALAPVTADATYTATYRQTVLAESDNQTPTLSATLSEYRLAFDAGRVRFDALLSSARDESRQVVLTLPGLTATLNRTAILTLRTAGVTHAAVLTDTNGGVGIDFLDANGKSIRVFDGLYLSLPYTDNVGHPTLYATDASGYDRLCAASADNGTLTCAGISGQTYRVLYRYTLTVEAEGGTLFANASRYAVNENIALTSYPKDDHFLSSIVLLNNETGEQTAVDSLASLTMPAYHATLRVVFIPKTYTVSFVSRGETVSLGEYRLGDTVSEPAIVTDFEEDGYRYAFIGWSAPIGTVTGDAVYTAKFYAMNLAESPNTGTGSDSALTTVIWQIGIPAILAFVLFIVLLILLVRVLVRRSKKKKAKKAAVEIDPQTQQENQNHE